MGRAIAGRAEAPSRKAPHSMHTYATVRERSRAIAQWRCVVCLLLWQVWLGGELHVGPARCGAVAPTPSPPGRRRGRPWRSGRPPWPEPPADSARLCGGKRTNGGERSGEGVGRCGEVWGMGVRRGQGSSGPGCAGMAGTARRCRVWPTHGVGQPPNELGICDTCTRAHLHWLARSEPRPGRRQRRRRWFAPPCGRGAAAAARPLCPLPGGRGPV